MDAIDKFPKYKRLQDRMRSSQFEEYVRRSDENRAKFVESMKAEPGISEKWYLPSYSKDDWKEVSVPGLWSEEELVSLDGVVWQTCRFQCFELYRERGGFEYVIDDDHITWINGQKIGETVGYDVRRLYSVPAGVLKELNEITLKISEYRGGVRFVRAPANEMRLKVR